MNNCIKLLFQNYNLWEKRKRFLDIIFKQFCIWFDFWLHKHYLCLSDTTWSSSQSHKYWCFVKVAISCTRWTQLLVFVPEISPDNTSPPAFMHLHWLLVKSHISYKIPLVTNKFFNALAPQYLLDLLLISDAAFSMGQRLLLPLLKHAIPHLWTFSKSSWNVTYSL